MRPVEVLVKDSRGEITPFPFPSVRKAFRFIEGSIDKTFPYLFKSRIACRDKISEEWLMVAAESRGCRLFLIRYKPTTNDRPIQRR